MQKKKQKQKNWKKKWKDKKQRRKKKELEEKKREDAKDAAIDAAEHKIVRDKIFAKEEKSRNHYLKILKEKVAEIKRVKEEGERLTKTGKYKCPIMRGFVKNQEEQAQRKEDEKHRAFLAQNIKQKRYMITMTNGPRPIGAFPLTYDKQIDLRNGNNPGTYLKQVRLAQELLREKQSKSVDQAKKMQELQQKLDDSSL